MQSTNGFAILMIGILIGQPIIFAEMITARVASVNPESNTIQVNSARQTDPNASSPAALPETLELSLSEAVQKNGFQNLNDLNAGDEITFEANQNGNTWQAVSISVGAATDTSNITGQDMGNASTAFSDINQPSSSSFGTSLTPGSGTVGPSNGTSSSLANTGVSDSGANSTAGTTTGSTNASSF